MKLIGKILLVILLVGALVAAILLLAGDGGGKVTSAAPVMLNEVMTSNKGSVIDPEGNFSDWLEIYNYGDSAADISGYGLSDSITEGAKYVFPANTIIDAKAYLVIFCTGDKNASGHFAPFKLSTKDDLVLMNVSGRVIDSVALKSVVSGATLGRDPQKSDNWIELNEPSPGFPNTAEGAQAYRESLSEGADIGVYINEFMAANATTIFDANGEYSDWIELINTTDKEVDLSGFGISDEIGSPLKYRLPEGTMIAPNGFLIIFCSGNEGIVEGELHAPFGLRAYSEDVVLASRLGQILSSYSYSNQETDKSMARVPDGTGEFEVTSRPTPGYPNTDAGYDEFMKERSASLNTAVYLSEILGLNHTGFLSEGGEYYDWIELYNSSDSDFNLAGYALSDNGNNPAKWVFPEISIEAKSYMLVLASGNNVKDTQKKNLETNFSISGTGESVYFFDPDGICLDKLQVSSFKGDMSYGRSLSGELLWYDTPTPSAPNAEGKRGFTSQPIFVTLPGIFDSQTTVELSADQGETIHYTLDCSTPTESSPVYSGPITLDKNTVVRAISVREDCYPGYTSSGTFLFRTDEVNHELPVMCLVTDNKNLFDENTGIYAYGAKWDPETDEWPYWETPANFWQEWERPASFEVFDDAGKEVFSQNIGICISGSFGQGREQKGFAVIARDEYGDNRMEYPFFEDLPYTEYKALVLRCGAQDQTLSKIRDELAAGLLKGSDVNFLYQDYKPYVLYLNGRYWGVYFMREKRNRFFVAQHENTDNVTDMNIIKSATRVNYGEADNWGEIESFVASHDLSIEENYAWLDERVDLDSFMDYIICEIYVANSDYWNIQEYRLDGGKWKFIFYDFCWGFHNVNHETVKERISTKRPPLGMLKALLKSNSWKDRFCRRFAQLMQTVYEPSRVVSLIEELYAQVEPEIERERSIFNSTDSPYFDYVDPNNISTYKAFATYIERAKTFAMDRPDIIKAQLQSELGLSDAYMKEVFG